MYLTICNDKKTKFNVGVPPYTTFIRTILEKTIQNASGAGEMVSLPDYISSHVNTIDMIVRTYITSLVPLDGIIKTDFDTVSVHDVDEEEEKEDDKYVMPITTNEEVTDVAEVPHSSPIFEGDATNAMKEETETETKPQTTVVFTSDLTMEEITKAFQDVKKTKNAALLPDDDDNDDIINDEEDEVGELLRDHDETVSNDSYPDEIHDPIELPENEVV